ncbi:MULTISPECIES: FtsK/SpoIIIE domain-containing protein [Paenibacillus]|uniref:FtsK/SpoIIIE domain-containing protein n=1 Tax=Paenibacillus TaxID=44249 RepID=UPI0021B38822|nr:FtsK/SpoIIIE domain-containing protein [Paenibacillus sp. IHBB 10380]
MIMSGVGGIAIIKLAAACGCLGGAWTVYRTTADSMYRTKMRRLFVAGEICLKRRGRQGKEVRAYPQVSRVTVYHDCVQVVFVLPNGLDPKEVRKRDWLFEQTFGDNIELSGSSKTFTLNIYSQGVQRFDYDPEAVVRAVEGLRLPIYVGRSRTGDEVYDMTEHPHLLVAGETGSGKSVALRSILTTLIRTAADRLELYCADLKRSEFHLFKGVAREVVVETPQLHKIVLKIRKEMRRRGDLLDREGLANLDDLPEGERPPYIVLAIDEVALLKKERDLMDGIEEISAIGRALGVFLILSMQRPDSDVLDGKLKNNLTVRMAFRHSDEINSRITLGSGEAADIQQSQKGRMVLKLDGLTTVQGPYLDLPNAKALLETYKRAEEPAAAQNEPEISEDDETIEIGVL